MCNNINYTLFNLNKIIKMTTQKDTKKIRSLYDEMLSHFRNLEKDMKETKAKVEGVATATDKDTLFVVKEKVISKFGERGAHLMVPKEFVDHYADIIIKKKKREVHQVK